MADLNPGTSVVPTTAAGQPLEGEFIGANEPTIDLAKIIPGPKVLLLGGGGTGKSHSLSTLVESGLQVACIFTEPSGIETITSLGVDRKRFHWAYVPPGAPSFDAMEDVARKINTLSFKSLTQLEDIDKRKYNQWLDFVALCRNFKCAWCGQAFGPLDHLDAGWASALDSLSGMNELAMKLVVGLKPVKSMGDWGVAMDNLGNFVTTFTTSLKCLGVITAHLERETDPNTGSSTFQAATLGQKLAPKIGRYFSDIVLAKREAKTFTWSTAATGVDLKVRNLPLQEGLQPSFKAVVQAWHKRIGYSTAKSNT